MRITDRRLFSQQYADFSPALYSPSDVDDYGTDFTTDSAPSPGSPLPPAITALYSLPKEGDWIPWDKIELSGDLLKTEPFEDAILSSVPVQNMSLSPSINPMDLTNAQVNDILFCHEGINDSQPLFQTRFPLATDPLPTARPQPTTTQLQVTQLQQQANPSMAKKPARSTQLSEKRQLRGHLKRKSCSSEDNDQLSQRSSASPTPNSRRSSKDSDTTATGPKKSAHNMIEKRYRNNLNDKIAALRDAVPALRVMVHRLESGPGENGSSEGDEGCGEEDGFGVGRVGGTDDLGGLAPAHKLNKATILGKATEYIVHLERRNRNLAKENAALRSRMEGFEMLVMGRGGGEGMWN